MNPDRGCFQVAGFRLQWIQAGPWGRSTGEPGEAEGPLWAGAGAGPGRVGDGSGTALSHN